MQFRMHQILPRVRDRDETVKLGEDGKAVISEELCVGCGICVKKCPTRAIMIIGCRISWRTS